MYSLYHLSAKNPPPKGGSGVLLLQHQGIHLRLQEIPQALNFRRDAPGPRGISAGPRARRQGCGPRDEEVLIIKELAPTFPPVIKPYNGKVMKSTYFQVAPLGSAVPFISG